MLLLQQLIQVYRLNHRVTAAAGVIRGESEVAGMA
jgi:hypothetical protein